MKSKDIQTGNFIPSSNSKKLPFGLLCLFLYLCTSTQIFIEKNIQFYLLANARLIKTKYFRVYKTDRKNKTVLIASRNSALAMVIISPEWNNIVEFERLYVTSEKECTCGDNRNSMHHESLVLFNTYSLIITIRPPPYHQYSIMLTKHI
ncbi:hypothetical protein DCO56_14330 [Sphingobacterium athyrii]|uniref:Uncharacterized protein n=1 Tax=Sphingobacterium athyrii TaxID=2152717 RepID=A0A363NUM4_9SPHI|nr:hypothetical protein DCO56_14330 [Sphingobacterium athyrii]